MKMAQFSDFEFHANLITFHHPGIYLLQRVQKKINYDNIIEFVSKKNYQYLVVSFSDDLFYCFDLKLQAERKIAKKLFWVNCLPLFVRMML
jgi:hypothetical protein